MTQLDPERQEQAKRYARIKRRLWLVDQGCLPAVCLALAGDRVVNRAREPGWLD
jgi:hypothetical protein